MIGTPKVVYRTRGNRALWASGTHEKDIHFAFMKEDGNFGICDTDDDRVWSSQTNASIGAFLIMQDDINLVWQFGQ